MPTNVSRSVDRRRLLQVLGASGALAVAGCLGDEESDEPAESDDGTGADDMDDGTSGADSEDPNLEPAPTGAALTNDEIRTLVDAFDDRVFQGEQSDPFTPSHVTKWVSDDTFIFLHFDEPNPEEANNLLWVGVGTKGVFSEAGQPGPEFTHFHQYEADDWDGGHGGEVGDEGYWLTHIAVDEFESPFGETEPGVDYEFMPTPPAAFDGDSVADFEIEGQGGLDDDDIETLIELFDDEPFEGGQAEDGYPNVPAHIAKWVTEDVFVFLHFDEPDLREASDLIYYGIGVRGEFTAESQPHEDDFTHFHKWNAESWDGGHGGQEGQHGYWLVHHAVRPLEMPWGDVAVGVDRNFMPTPLE
ncbi:hypothetical protein [Natronorubrum thiooxidans]|uniref:Uncharacterized protein n=1 Tax=Natronorubrum thiooxidans TaxID=308853 RepID=A0A1N7GLT4_9EURY|nr:hypothetical protein [Natronorubrum thiooxidans]SIS13466.1 hypothetical protein SAMN05421752_11350 [Natronorubrum thiooxidans]